MDILIIGGSRNIGYYLTKRLFMAGHRITVLNRGITPNELPDGVARLQSDRTDVNQLRRALNGRTFDLVVDTVLYKGEEAENIVDILNGHVGHYVFISTGQVYLVREGIHRPWKEEDYEGPIMPAPEINTYDYEEWLYGYQKRACEDVLAAAYGERDFPYTSLRLPMVNSERDTFKRLYSYLLRIQDGGPILVPDEPNYRLRHIYAGDVVEAIVRVFESGIGKGRAFNISQEETITLNDFLKLMGDIIGVEPHIVTLPRDLLQANGFLPDCSPFSDTWMSELDNTRSKDELGMVYTPLRTYLERIINFYLEYPPAKPHSYRRRHAEKHLASSLER